MSLSLLAIGLAALALGQAPPAVQPGERPPAAAVVPGPARVISLRAGEVMVFRLAAAAEGTGMVILREGEAARGSRLASGELRAALAVMDGTQALLTVESENPFFVSYQAVMTMADGSAVPTTVCTLLPNGQPSYEHWPHPVASVTLFGFERADDAAVACG